MPAMGNHYLQLALMAQSGNSGAQVQAMASIFHPFVFCHVYMSVI